MLECYIIGSQMNGGGRGGRPWTTFLSYSVKVCIYWHFRENRPEYTQKVANF